MLVPVVRLTAHFLETNQHFTGRTLRVVQNHIRNETANLIFAIILQFICTFTSALTLFTFTRAPTHYN